jgi:hypothetical protein
MRPGFAQRCRTQTEPAMTRTELLEYRLHAARQQLLGPTAHYHYRAICHSMDHILDQLAVEYACQAEIEQLEQWWEAA